jgi:hypothetical protein
MVTKLDRTLRREIPIKGRAYVLTIDDRGLKLTLKGHRKGQELAWADFVSGEAAFAMALNASLSQANDEPGAAATPAKKKKKRRPSR